MNLMSQEEILYCDRQNGSKGKECKCVCHQENYPLPKNFSNPIEPQGSWEEVKKNFINELVALVYKHFDCTVQCEDCGGFLLHICEKAFREWNSTFFDKVRTEAIKEERRRIDIL